MLQSTLLGLRRPPLEKPNVPAGAGWSKKRESEKIRYVHY